MPKFSPNKKLNYVLQDIYDSLEELGADEVNHYKKDFPREIDFNLAQYGNLLVYYDQVRDLYIKAGYETVKKWSDDKIWETYKRQVGYVARNYF